MREYVKQALKRILTRLGLVALSPTARQRIASALQDQIHILEDEARFYRTLPDDMGAALATVAQERQDVTALLRQVA